MFDHASCLTKIKLIPSLLHTESFILSLFFTLQFQLRTPNAQPECKPLKWSWGLNANSHFGPFFFSSLLFLSHRNIEWPRCENNKNKPVSHVWSGRGGRSAKQPGSFFIQHKDVLNFFHPVNKRRPIKTITFVNFVSVLRGAIKPFNTLNIGGTRDWSNKPQREIVWLILFPTFQSILFWVNRKIYFYTNHAIKILYVKI